MRLLSFHPETALFRHGGVKLRACLCGVPMYASAQSLDFLAMTKNCSLPNRKQIVSHPVFPDGNYLNVALMLWGFVTSLNVYLDTAPTEMPSTLTPAIFLPVLGVMVKVCGEPTFT